MNLFSKGKDEYISHHRRSAQLHLIQNNGFFFSSDTCMANFMLCLGFIASTRLISILLTLKQLEFNNNLICNSNHKRYKNIYYWYGVAIVWKFKKKPTHYLPIKKKANEFKTCLRSNSLDDDLLSLPISHFSQVFICFNDVLTCNKQNTNYKRKDVFYIFLCKISAPPPPLVTILY